MARNEQLRSELNVFVKPEWVESCIASRESGNRTGPDEDLHFLFSRFLCSDLNIIGDSCLPADIQAQHQQVLQGTYVLQVDETINVAAPAKSRYSSDARGTRCLKMLFTDGHRQVTALELQHCPQMHPAQPAGVKVAVRNVLVRRGMLLLRPENVVVLGGQVGRLEHARQQAAAKMTEPVVGRRRRDTGQTLFQAASAAAWAQQPQEERQTAPCPPTQPQQQSTAALQQQQRQPMAAQQQQQQQPTAALQQQQLPPMAAQQQQQQRQPMAAQPQQQQQPMASGGVSALTALEPQALTAAYGGPPAQRPALPPSHTAGRHGQPSLLPPQQQQQRQGPAHAPGGAVAAGGTAAAPAAAAAAPATAAPAMNRGSGRSQEGHGGGGGGGQGWGVGEGHGMDVDDGGGLDDDWPFDFDDNGGGGGPFDSQGFAPPPPRPPPSLPSAATAAAVAPAVAVMAPWSAANGAGVGGEQHQAVKATPARAAAAPRRLQLRLPPAAGGRAGPSPPVAAPPTVHAVSLGPGNNGGGDPGGGSATVAAGHGSFGGGSAAVAAGHGAGGGGAGGRSHAPGSSPGGGGGGGGVPIHAPGSSPGGGGGGGGGGRSHASGSVSPGETPLGEPPALRGGAVPFVTARQMLEDTPPQAAPGPSALAGNGCGGGGYSGSFGAGGGSGGSGGGGGGSVGPSTGANRGGFGQEEEEGCDGRGPSTEREGIEPGALQSVLAGWDEGDDFDFSPTGDVAMPCGTGLGAGDVAMGCGIGLGAGPGGAPDGLGSSQDDAGPPSVAAQLPTSTLLQQPTTSMPSQGRQPRPTPGCSSSDGCGDENEPPPPDDVFGPPQPWPGSGHQRGNVNTTTQQQIPPCGVSMDEDMRDAAQGGGGAVPPPAAAGDADHAAAPPPALLRQRQAPWRDSGSNIVCPEHGPAGGAANVGGVDVIVLDASCDGYDGDGDAPIPDSPPTAPSPRAAGDITTTAGVQNDHPTGGVTAGYSHEPLSARPGPGGQPQSRRRHNASAATDPLHSPPFTYLADVRRLLSGATATADASSPCAFTPSGHPSSSPGTGPAGGGGPLPPRGACGDTGSSEERLQFPLRLRLLASVERVLGTLRFRRDDDEATGGSGGGGGGGGGGTPLPEFGLDLVLEDGSAAECAVLAHEVIAEHIGFATPADLIAALEGGESSHAASVAEVLRLSEYLRAFAGLVNVQLDGPGQPLVVTSLDNDDLRDDDIECLEARAIGASTAAALLPSDVPQAMEIGGEGMTAGWDAN